MEDFLDKFVANFRKFLEESSQDKERFMEAFLSKILGEYLLNFGGFIETF